MPHTLIFYTLLIFPLFVLAATLFVLTKYARIKKHVIIALATLYVFNFLFGVLIAYFFSEEFNSERSLINFISAGVLSSALPTWALLYTIKEGVLRDIWVDKPRARTIDI